MKQIYFLCTGNSCRSQMAEGFAKQIMGSKWQVKSAGLETHGLNPLAVQVMAENNIDISSQFSKLIDTDFLFSSDLVVTLCGDARDRCPVTPSSVKKLHWPLRDPAQANGTQEEILTVFRKVRDEIEVRVLELKAELELEK
ncbi:arsenate reductase (thioredoxin) [Paucilactobacillus wasatchensis]|uniref:Arsenate reductase n=1 Tax=Paucilactobacillus wasatchensis TaxID=1335616 RepID=A0A0D1AAF0_9LACO|nr:arsenate reductase (thioredoxin) [Paucilactobacillus wasatchensis]KIS03676.1 Arsenate reductase [Paucilactobacillus wasatchensis]